MDVVLSRHSIRSLAKRGGVSLREARERRRWKFNLLNVAQLSGKKRCMTSLGRWVVGAGVTWQYCKETDASKNDM